MNIFLGLKLPAPAIALAVFLVLHTFAKPAYCVAVPPAITLPGDISSGIQSPVRIAMDSSGNYYVTDPKAGGILKYGNTGMFIRKYPTAAIPVGIAIAGNGDILATQITNVAVMDPATGNVKSRFGIFAFASAIAIDPSGNIYVTDSRSNNIQKFGTAYNLLVTSSLTLSRPTGIVYEKSLNLVAVVNTMAGNIKFLNPADLTLAASNNTLGIAGTANGRFVYPMGIAFEYEFTGELKRIYVSDTYENSVQVFDGIARTWIANIGGYGFDVGKLAAPRDILFDATDSYTPRLLVANGSGTVAVFGCDVTPRPGY